MTDGRGHRRPGYRAPGTAAVPALLALFALLALLVLLATAADAGRADEGDASDGTEPSGAGDVSAPTPPPAPSGPAVTTSVTRAGANRLLVVVQAQPGQTISRIDWTLPANAAAETTDGTPLPPTGPVLPAPAQSFSFHLRRTGGTSVTLPMSVRGSFGEWRTFVGGGANAW